MNTALHISGVCLLQVGIPFVSVLALRCAKISLHSGNELVKMNDPNISTHRNLCSIHIDCVRGSVGRAPTSYHASYAYIYYWLGECRRITPPPPPCPHLPSAGSPFRLQPCSSHARVLAHASRVHSSTGATGQRASQGGSGLLSLYLRYTPRGFFRYTHALRDSIFDIHKMYYMCTQSLRERMLRAPLLRSMAPCRRPWPQGSPA